MHLQLHLHKYPPVYSSAVHEQSESASLSDIYAIKSSCYDHVFPLM